MNYDVYDYVRSEKVYLFLAVALPFGLLHADTNGMLAFIRLQHMNRIGITFCISPDSDETDQKYANQNCDYVPHNRMNAHNKLRYDQSA
jgi:hypothetical protein